MPCNSDGYPDDDAINADRATRAACNLVSAIRTEKLWSRIQNKLTKETEGWVEEHDRIDRKRRKDEAKARKEKQAKRDALAKLSKKELKLLGFIL